MSGEATARPARAPGSVSERIAGGLMIVIWQPHDRGFSASHWQPGTSAADGARRRDCSKSLLRVEISIPGSDRVRQPGCRGVLRQFSRAIQQAFGLLQGHAWNRLPVDQGRFGVAVPQQPPDGLEVLVGEEQMTRVEVAGTCVATPASECRSRYGLFDRALNMGFVEIVAPLLPRLGGTPGYALAPEGPSRSFCHRLEGHKDFIYAVGFSPDASRAVTGSYDRDLRLWRVADGKEIAHMTGHGDKVHSLAVAPDGTIASGDNSRRNPAVGTPARGPEQAGAMGAFCASGQARDVGGLLELQPG